MLLTRIELHLLRVGRCRHPEWVTLRGGRLTAIDFPALAALLIHPTAGPILYDTGYAEHFRTATAPFPERLYRWLTPVHLPAEEALGAQLGRRGIALGDVRQVLISHFHADHVAGLRDLPGAGFLALSADVQAGLGHRGWQALRRGVLPALLPPDFTARLALADERPVVDLGPGWAPFEAAYDLLGDQSLLAHPAARPQPGPARRPAAHDRRPAGAPRRRRLLVGARLARRAAAVDRRPAAVRELAGLPAHTRRPAHPRRPPAGARDRALALRRDPGRFRDTRAERMSRKGRQA